MKKVKVVCPYDGKVAKLVTGKRIYPHRSELHHRFFWLCPKCGAYVGTHAGSKVHKPLGRLANAELRKAKVAAHEAFDWLWKSGKSSRQDAYTWLAGAMGMSIQECHIGMFNERQCYEVVSIMSRRKDEILDDGDMSPYKTWRNWRGNQR